MEKPKVRFLNIQPLGDKFLITDPLGLSEPIVVTLPFVLILSLMDGTRTHEDIKAEFLRRTGSILTSEDLKTVIETLDKLYFLLNDRFEEKLKQEREKILSAGVKTPSHAGEAYPKDPKELEKFLKGSLLEIPKVKAKGLLVPHMDMRVALPTYGIGYSAVDADPETVVVLGVSHYFHATPLSVCPLDFETPLGRVEVDKEVVDKLQKLFDHDLFEDILAYKNEHSVEFQMPFVKLLFPKAKVVPMIVSYGEKDFLKEASEKIVKALEGRDFLVISSVDMSHVGRKFGDPHSYDPSPRDKEYLDLLSKMKNEEAFDLLASDNNRTRIDGQFTNFVFLEILSLVGSQEGKTLDYKIYHEDPTDSKVSYASMVFF